MLRRKTARQIFWLAVFNALTLCTATFFPLFLPLDVLNMGRPNIFILIPLVVDFIAFMAYIRFLWMLRAKMIPVHTNVKDGHTHTPGPSKVIPPLMTRSEMKKMRPIDDYKGRIDEKSAEPQDTIYRLLESLGLSECDWMTAMELWCDHKGKPEVAHWWNYMMVNPIAVIFDEGTQVGKIRGSGDSIFIFPEILHFTTSHSVTVTAKLVPYRGLYELEIPTQILAHLYRFAPKAYEFGRVSIFWGFVPDLRHYAVEWAAVPVGGSEKGGFVFDADGIICPKRVALRVERERADVVNKLALIERIVKGALNEQTRMLDARNELIRQQEKKPEPEQPQPIQQSQQGGAPNGNA